MKKIFLSILIVLSLGLLPSGVALAATGNMAVPSVIPCVPSLPCVSKVNQLSGTANRSYIFNVVGKDVLLTIMGISGITAVGFIIWGGLQMHLSMGVEDTIGKAKKTIIWAIVGLVVSTLSAATVTIISQIPIK